MFTYQLPLSVSSERTKFTFHSSNTSHIKEALNICDKERRKKNEEQKEESKGEREGVSYDSEGMTRNTVIVNI